MHIHTRKCTNIPTPKIPLKCDILKQSVQTITEARYVWLANDKEKAACFK